MGLLIGTSGWTYDSWKGAFYPEKLAKAKWLPYYCTLFNTVEVNATFYRTLKGSTYEKWRETTPEGFTWAVKASRYITHVKRLKTPEETVPRFLESASILGEKLGPILLQLPPTLAYEKEIARDFFQFLPKEFRFTLETRHDSWLDDGLFALLEEHNIAWCVSDTAGKHACVEAATADFVYLRLHGSQEIYKSSYTDEELEHWAELVTGWSRDAYIYFDNTMTDAAARNALRLKELMGVDD
ncbi:Uncharacterized conserved protein YecE, DUF72 family [Desulfatibacillum alkenivorans DSM 16219]|jgi:uncharacterized protein YecE (DUF72 family)|uniref:Uncharacterized conserved protein YecE, DUF72 family n=1 Tax=Desulfatibacillum alkenivorans DSM 16219 TaxID=1121393 RepID=A0A1M6GTI7_9BACT|nr:DUF72 domain-containing protein [Desulfatibacillum alkenivorans]SHJ13220.1 Uncharacterized conserved protein YecE, DUF72 family [Desulfatibacillum alkenivorans DSM 16219]